MSRTTYPILSNVSISSQHEKIICVSGVLYPEVIPSTNFNTFVNLLLSSIAFSLLLQIYNIFLLKLMRDWHKAINNVLLILSSELLILANILFQELTETYNSLLTVSRLE